MIPDTPQECAKAAKKVSDLMLSLNDAEFNSHLQNAVNRALELEGELKSGKQLINEH